MRLDDQVLDSQGFVSIFDRQDFSYDSSTLTSLEVEMADVATGCSVFFKVIEFGSAYQITKFIGPINEFSTMEENLVYVSRQSGKGETSFITMKFLALTPEEKTRIEFMIRYSTFFFMFCNDFANAFVARPAHALWLLRLGKTNPTFINFGSMDELLQKYIRILNRSLIFVLGHLDLMKGRWDELNLSIWMVKTCRI